MVRLIDADALAKDICENYRFTGFVELLEDFASAIRSQPTVDAVPVKHGKWIDDGQYADFFPHHEWRCSKCGEHVIEIDTPWYKYCPNCGAKMDGAERRDDAKR